MNTKSFLLASSVLSAASAEAGADVDVSATTHRADAINMAHQMGEATDAELSGLIIKNEDVKRGPISVMLALQEAYGDKLKEFPVPDSEGGNNPDKYQATDVQDDGSQKTVDTSFYKDFFEATPTGETWKTRLALVRLCIKSTEHEKLPRTGDNADVFEHRNQPMWLNQEKRTLEQRLTNGKNMAKKAMKCYLNLAALSEYSDKVDYDYNTDDEGSLRRGFLPVTIKNPSNAAEFRNLTANEVARMDVARVAKSEGGLTFEKLAASLSKKGGTTSGTGQTGEKLVIPHDKVYDQFLRMVNTFDTETPEGTKRLAALEREMNEGRKESDQWVKTFGDMMMVLDPVWSKIEKRYRGLNSTATKAA